MESRTCEGWLIWLDQQSPTEEDWKNPEYVHLISEIMMWLIPRRLGQILIDAGEAVDARPEYR